MKFIEIKEGICVRKDEVIALESLSTMTCRVILENTAYDSNFSYETIKKILESSDDQPIRSQ